MTASTQKPRILIIEDTTDIADLLVIRLELAGYAACVATNATNAMTAVWSFKPNGILLDIGLPDRDGFDVLRILKGNAKTAEIPVLMLTARQAIADVKKALAMGAKDYVTKPFDDQKLLFRVARMLGLTTKSQPEKIAYLWGEDKL